MASQMPTMMIVVLRNMNSKLPTNLYRKRVVRWIGLTSNRSTDPLASMFGMNDAVMMMLRNIVNRAPMAPTMRSPKKETMSPRVLSDSGLKPLKKNASNFTTSSGTGNSPKNKWG